MVKMAETKTFRIRRAIVRTLYEYAGAQECATVYEAPEVWKEAPSQAEMDAAWQTLIDAAILLPLGPYGADVCRLAPDVRAYMDTHGELPDRAELFGFSRGAR